MATSLLSVRFFCVRRDEFELWKVERKGDPRRVSILEMKVHKRGLRFLSFK